MSTVIGTPGQSNEQDMVLHYKEVGRDREDSQSLKIRDQENDVSFPRWEDWDRDPGNDLFLGFLCLCKSLTEVRKKRSEELGLSLKNSELPTGGKKWKL